MARPSVRSTRRSRLRVESLENREVPHIGHGMETHVGILRSSQIPPPEQTESTFVIDEGAYLDTDCTYASGGPLNIDISPTRYIGDKDILLAQGLIPASITLRLPAYDVDVNGAPGFPNEVDRVYFNGHELQTLTGDNNIWHENVFSIQTEWMDFGTLDQGGNTANTGTYAPGTNTLKIVIDTLSAPDENWCTAVDWVSYTIPAPNPVLLVHGINPIPGAYSPDTWKDGGADGPFMVGLEALGIPYIRADLGRLDYISSNAGKLEALYQSMRSSWATDPDQPFRVDMVTHSHGGLDARHWVENRDRVDQLFQLGTPNAGSPLADLIQRGVFSIGGIVGSVAAGLAAPAGYELTTVFMAGYNALHSFNPDVRYASFGGDYTFGGLGIWDAALSSIHSGPSDTIVPVWSINSFAPTVKQIFATTEDNTQAMHTSMTVSPYLASQVLPQLRQAAPNTQVMNRQSAPVARAAVGKTTPIPPATIVDPTGAAGAVTAGGTTSHTIVVDNTTGKTRFTLLFEAGDIDLELQSPSGAIFNEGNVAGNADVKFFFDFSIPGLSRKGFEFAPGAETGAWQVRAIGTDLPAGETVGFYLVAADQEKSPISLLVETNQAAVLEGTPFQVTAKLRKGSAGIRDAVVQGELRAPDGTIAPMTLVDDGTNGDVRANDGIYTATVAGVLPSGLYAMRVSATGPASLPFARQGTQQVAIAAAGSSFTNANITTQDDNENFLFDRVRAGISINAGVAGFYRVTATLADFRGKAIETVSGVAEFTAGSNAITLDFDGALVYARRKNGPLILKDLKLEQDVGSLYSKAAEEKGTFLETGIYQYIAFEHEQMSLKKGGSTKLVDADHDKFHDSLTIKLPVKVDAKGDYQWSGTLVNAAGQVVADASGFSDPDRPFKKGSNKLTFSFSGEDIFNSRNDGPYRVVGIILDGPNGALRVDSTYTTKNFSAAKFETGHVLVKATLSVTPPPTTGGMVDELSVTFTTPIQAGSFTTADLVLKRGKSVQVLPPSVTIEQIDATHFVIKGLASIASAPGRYTLELIGKGLLDADGFSLFDTISTKWKVNA